jgi:hypothetical protein
VDSFNSKRPRNHPPPITFVKAGEKKASSANREDDIPSILSSANDWIIQADYAHKKATFPPEICPANDRPDIVIYSISTERVIWLELTVPAEENVYAAHTRKLSKYDELNELINCSGWSVHCFAIEVGARGCAAHSLHQALRQLGMPKRQKHQLLHDVAHISARCSFHIYINHDNPEWSNKTLLSPNDKI